MAVDVADVLAKISSIRALCALLSKNKVWTALRAQNVTHVNARHIWIKAWSADRLKLKDSTVATATAAKLVMPTPEQFLKHMAELTHATRLNRMDMTLLAASVK